MCIRFGVDWEERKSVLFFTTLVLGNSDRVLLKRPMVFVSFPRQATFFRPGVQVTIYGLHRLHEIGLVLRS